MKNHIKVRVYNHIYYIHINLLEKLELRHDNTLNIASLISCSCVMIFVNTFLKNRYANCGLTEINEIENYLNDLEPIRMVEIIC